MQTVISKSMWAHDVPERLKDWGALNAHTKNAVKISRGVSRESGQIWAFIWSQAEEWCTFL